MPAEKRSADDENEINEKQWAWFGRKKQQQIVNRIRRDAEELVKCEQKRKSSVEEKYIILLFCVSFCLRRVIIIGYTVQETRQKIYNCAYGEENKCG